MAGSYVDVPSWRMSWDRDGTQAYQLINNVPSQLGQGTLTALNSEGGGDNLWMDDSGRWLGLIFPELRDIDAFYIATYGNGGWPSSLQVSSNTTNLIDGTWTNLSPSAHNTTGFNDIEPGYRTAIVSTTALSVRAIKFNGQYGGSRTNRLKAFHLYGEPSPGENPKRLELWHATDDRRLDPAQLDWGNVPRGSSAEKSFRVKNMHSTLTAETVRVAMEGLTLSNPSMPGQHVLSTNGEQWYAQLTIGNIAPGATSQVLQLRRIVPTNAVLGVDTCRLFAEPLSWA